MNLTGSVGHRSQARDLIAIVHGPATSLVMSDAAHNARFGVPNPNSPLIAALLEQVVEIHVCSQALAGNKIDTDDLANGIVIDLSAMTTLALCQARG
ncbi:DsrE family protein [Sphingomonas aestuarii]